MVSVPSKKTLLFLQPLPPASPTLRPGAATSPIHSTTSSAGNPVDRRAAPVDQRQRERPRPLEQPRSPRPDNPPFEQSKGKRSLRPLKPPSRQVTNSYASVTTSVSVNPPPRPHKHSMLHACRRREPGTTAGVIGPAEVAVRRSKGWCERFCVRCGTPESFDSGIIMAEVAVANEV